MSKDDESGTRTDATSTKVDLGEDLLRSKNPRSGSKRKPSTENVDSGPIPQKLSEIEDQFQSAKILRNEGLIDEAKKVLRRILIADSHYKPARVALDEIHEMELQQIFGTAERPRRFLTGGPRMRKAPDIDAREVARSLDSDFRLGIFNEEGMAIPPSSGQLFEDSKQLTQFGDKLEKDLRDLNADDRLDIGIAFFEMELYEIAIRQFEAVIRLRSAGSAERRHLIAATALLGRCWLEAGRPYEAISAVQPGLTDSEASMIEKLELFYVMGCAYEALSKYGEAARWYQEARDIDPRYRDADERLRAARDKLKPRKSGAPGEQ